MSNTKFERVLIVLVNMQNKKEEAIIREAFPDMPEELQNNLIEVLKAYINRGDNLITALFYFLRHNLDEDQKVQFEIYINSLFNE